MSIRVFLSHAHEDWTFVNELTALFKERDITVTALNREATPLAEAFEAVNRDLQQCTAAVLVLSPNFLRSHWCNDELKAVWALRQTKRLPAVVVSHNMSRDAVLAALPLLAALPFIEGSEGVADHIEGISQLWPRRKHSWSLSPREPVPVVLAGCGQWAQSRTVIPLYREGARVGDKLFEIVAVTDLLNGEDEFHSVRSALAAAGAGRVTYYGHLNRALADIQQRPLAVIVNTPNTAHDLLADFALHAGCHVYAERPINVTQVRLADILRHAIERGLYFYSGTQRRLEYPYIYMANTLNNPERFGSVRSIRCTLASGRRGGGVDNWRRDPARAGGGVVIDEGYHLLDMALWLGQISEERLRVLAKSDVRGSCKFKYKEIEVYDNDRRQRVLAYGPGVETSAQGHLELPGGIDLVFDLSYAAPEGSVFECIELRDDHYARLRLTRDKPQRKPADGRPAEPGKILYQSGDGGLPVEGYANAEGTLELPRADDFDRFAAQDFRPLRQFITKVRSGTYDPDETLERGKNDCDARFLLSTHELLVAIYEMGSPKSDG